MNRLINLANFDLTWERLLAAGIALGIAIVAALIFHRLLFVILFRISKRTQTNADQIVFKQIYRPLRWSFVVVGVSLAAEVHSLVGQVWEGIARFVIPAILGWVALSLVRAFAATVDIREHLTDDLAADRSRKTRVEILSRVAAFAIIFVTVGLMLLGIPQVRNIGVTLMASAGLAALAVGAAAQPALKSLISGLQMAITEPIRLGDLVVIDGHTGRVEEIRMSFVVIRSWDERGIIVPTSRFLEESFENWSRQNEALTGPVYLHLDPATEIAPIRAEFIRFVKTQDQWDKRTAKLLMTEAHPESIELRLAVSAETISDLFDLRCALREHMIEWLRVQIPGALIRHRLEVAAANERVVK